MLRSKTKEIMEALKLFVVVLSLVSIGIENAVAQSGVCPVGADYWPHLDCTKFYICNHFGGPHFEETCPDGLYWDQPIVQCNWPNDVSECAGGTRPPYTTTQGPTTAAPSTTRPPTTTTPTTTTPTTTTPTTTTPTTTTPTTTTPTTTTQPPTTPPVEEIICPPGQAFWPHINCSLYYMCFGPGEYTMYRCPMNYLWNNAIQVCDVPENVDECLGGTRPPPGPATTFGTNPTIAPTTTTPTTTTPTTTTPTTTTPTTTTTTTTSTTTTTELPTTLSNLPQCPSFNIKLKHSEICEAFWLCQDGELIQPYFMCPGGLYFDEIEQKCNLASEVDCTPAANFLRYLFGTN